MDLALSGQRILVTGSSRGIGLALVKAFIEEGCKVVANGRNEKKLSHSISKFNNCFGVVGDVGILSEAKVVINKASELLGGIDTIICNVGNGSSVDPGNESYEEWQRMLSLNFFTTTNIIESSRRLLKESKGNIVCISSICGCEVVPGAPITYSVSKAALNAYVKGISRPLAEEGVRINAIAPGNIVFDDSVWDRKLKEDKERVELMLKQNVSLKKLGKPEDITDIVLWLSSTKANFVTGSIFVVDGGQIRS